MYFTYNVIHLKVKHTKIAPKSDIRISGVSGKEEGDGSEEIKKSVFVLSVLRLSKQTEAENDNIYHRSPCTLSQ